MKIRTSPSSSAIALIIVMIVIVVLAILAAGFAYSMKTEIRLARQSNAEHDFEWMGRSGVELARCLLGKQLESGEPYDSLNQKWAGGPGNTNNDVMSSISMDHIELPEGSGNYFSVRIIDNERKFNINIADQRLLQQAMMVIGVDAGASPEIVDSILDWIDRDNDEHVSGAETDYYERLNPPYPAKNGWVDDMTELLLVRGMTPQIFWGTSSTNHPVAPVQLRDSFGRLEPEQISYPVGLYDLFTPLSSGKLNINTASATVLQMIPGLDTNLATAIIQHRAGPDGQDGTGDDIPFSNPGELATLSGIPPLVVNQLNSYCSVRSQVFEVHVECHIGDFAKECVATLYRRDPKNVMVVTMCWKPLGPAEAQNADTGPPQW